jgi:quaternary ammonium compound-resistance protein SugE
LTTGRPLPPCARHTRRGRPCFPNHEPGRGRPRRFPSERHALDWILLIVAGLFEVGWAVGLKHTAGFTRLWPSVATIASMVVSLALLGLALKSLPLGTAYAVWVGVGVIGTVAAGVVFFGEPAGLVKLLSVLFIMAGVVGLKLAA